MTSTIRSVIALAVSAGLLAAATTPMSAAPGPAGLKGQTIRLLAWGDPAFVVLQKLSPMLEAQTGMKLQVEIKPFDAVRQQVLLNAQNPASSYEIVATDLPLMGEYEPLMVDLSRAAKADAFDHSDFYDAVWQAGIKNQKLIGVPFANQPEVFGYRKDIFAKYHLKPPSTMSDVIKTAEILKQKDPDIAGVCWNAARGTPLGQSFIQMMGSSGQPVINLAKTSGTGFDVNTITPDNMKPMVDSEAGKTVAAYMMQLMKYSPRGILNMAWDDRTRVFANGGCAMAYQWASLSAAHDQDPQAPAYGKIGYVGAPAGDGAKTLSPLGGPVLAVPKNVSPEKQAVVWAALKILTSKDVLRRITLSGACITVRKSLGKDPKIIEKCPVVAAVDGMMAKGQVAAWPRPPVPEIQPIVDVLGSTMHEMIAGDTTPENAISSSTKDIDRIMHRAGYY